MKKIFSAAIIICTTLIVSCSSGKKDHKTDTIPEEVAPAQVDSAAARPDNAGDAVAEKCFENEGLKFNTRISLYFNSATIVSGTVTVTEAGGTSEEKAEFTGTRNGDEIKVLFTGTPPVIGESSEWTSKPWTLKHGSTSLSIVFNAKNYETGKWGEVVYDFERCQ